MREFQTNRKPHGALQGAKLDKFEALDSMRDSLMQKRDDLVEMQNVLESELAADYNPEIAEELDAVMAELDKTNGEIKSFTSEIDELVKADKADFDSEVAELTARQESLMANRDSLEAKVGEKRTTSNGQVFVEGELFALLTIRNIATTNNQRSTKRYLPI